MKAVLVHYDDYPWDVRIEKFLGTLADVCDEVHLIARNRQRRPVREQIGSVTCHRLHLHSPTSLWGALPDSPAFLNPRWFFRIGEVIKEVAPDVVIVRDLPLALACRYWVSRVGASLVFDMAEDYPAMFSAYHPWEGIRERLANLLLRNETLARGIERASVLRADRILVVTEEQRDRVVRMGVSKDKIVIVRNTPRTIPAAASANGSGTLEIIYVGEVHHMRGLDCAIRAVGRLKRQNIPVHFRILGSGKTESALRALAAREAGEYVTFEGWVDHRRIPGELARSHVGLVPHQRNKLTNTTIPNKLFDYMATAIPVLVSDAAPLKRIVEETACGLVFPSGDEGALANALAALRSADLRSRLGSNGRHAVEQRYHWSADAAVLKQVVIDCARRSKTC